MKFGCYIFQPPVQSNRDRETDQESNLERLDAVLPGRVEVSHPPQAAESKVSLSQDAAELLQVLATQSYFTAEAQGETGGGAG